MFRKKQMQRTRRMKKGCRGGKREREMA